MMLGGIEHDCEKEYWSHCLRCVLGANEDYSVKVLGGDGLSAPFYTEVVVTFADGDVAHLVRRPGGWCWHSTGEDHERQNR